MILFNFSFSKNSKGIPCLSEKDPNESRRFTPIYGREISDAKKRQSIFLQHFHYTILYVLLSRIPVKSQPYDKALWSINYRFTNQKWVGYNPIRND